MGSYIRIFVKEGLCKQFFSSKLTLSYVLNSFPNSSVGKESTCNEGDLGLIPGLGRSPGEGIGYPRQYSGLENSMDCSPWGHKELDMSK